MKINIYYGGRGLIDDPTIYVVNKIQEVLEELRVKVERINLFEQKNSITTLPQGMMEADGIILATTVEWFGIGGYMQQFLDACWLFGNREKIQELYMQPVVMSTTYGEKEGEVTLKNAWEVLGGPVCDGLSGYVDNLIDFEMNQDYSGIIEKKAENLYRTISQKIVNLPSSNRAMQQSVLKTHHIELTPKESEQLSKYAADDTYIKKQKEDIEELSSMFKGMLSKQSAEQAASDLEQRIREAYQPLPEPMEITYLLEIEEKPQPLYIQIKGTEMECFYGPKGPADVSCKLSLQNMNDIAYGRMTFQRAFMTGVMTTRGEFRNLRLLDQMFVFK
ncbi:MAG: SCP2 sterol-binding domain-containing protein [Lachnospiraceae bacterium]|nr:SCP2 sterol-binding domain-containing protein [Lachnospiraceae bacterium]